MFHTQPHIGPASIRIRVEAHVKAEGKINRVLSAKNPAPINIQRIAQHGLHHAFHLGAFIGVITRYSGGPHHPAQDFAGALIHNRQWRLILCIENLVPHHLETHRRPEAFPGIFHLPKAEAHVSPKTGKNGEE